MTIFIQRGAQNPSGWTEAWQIFLIGYLEANGYFEAARAAGNADDDFGPKTEKATEQYQRAEGITVDGLVGAGTFTHALNDLFQPPDDWLKAAHEAGVIGVVEYTSRVAEPTMWRSAAYDGGTPSPIPDGYLDSSWPKPTDADGDGRRDLVYSPGGDVVGTFGWEVIEGDRNGRIRILDGWDAKNIAKVDIPQLIGVEGAPSSGTVRFHRAGAAQLQGFFREVEARGLLHLVKSWGGSFFPRLIRGSTSKLSNHSWGLAFDINAAWNGLGRQPALVGEEGELRSLVPIAERWGFYWGGWYRRRKDGMHFELVRLMSRDEYPAIPEVG